MTSAPIPSPHTPNQGPWSGRSIRAKIGFLCILACIQMVVTFTVTSPGNLVPDEGIYHWMVKSFAETGRLDIWNGHDEIASPELRYPLLVLHGDKLYPQFPFLFQLLAAPFYLISGFLGLFVLNSICFIAGTILWLLAAHRLFRDEDLALNAVLILVLATFTWEYSQGAWPHSVALLFAAGAFYCLVRAFYAEGTIQTRGFAALSGLIAGLAVGIRVDAVLIFPAVILPFLFTRPMRPVETFAVCIGLLPGLVLSAWTNFLKFGTFNPVSYGGSGGTPGTPLMLPAILGAVIVALLWTMTRSRSMELVGRHKLLTVVGLAALALGAVTAFPAIRVMLERFFDNAYICLVDVRALSFSHVFSQRTASGGMVYAGAHKKALLQSLPFLPLLVVPAAMWIRAEKDRSALALLLPFPICVISCYCYLHIALHAGGGFCLNQRYLLYALPFISILCAYGIAELKTMWGKPFGFPAAIVLGSATACVYFLMTRVLYTSIDAIELPLLVVPLWIAGFLLVLLVTGQFDLPPTAGKPIRIAAAAVIVVALTWSGLVALTYDYPHHRRVRMVHHLLGNRLMGLIPPDSIFFSDNKTYTASMALVEKERVRLAAAHLDGFRDMPRLLDFHLAAGRRAFALFHRSTWDALQAGPLKQYSINTVGDYSAFSIREITTKRRSSQPSPG
jgi:hypothetical protein